MPPTYKLFTPPGGFPLFCGSRQWAHSQLQRYVRISLVIVAKFGLGGADVVPGFQWLEGLGDIKVNFDDLPIKVKI